MEEEQKDNATEATQQAVVTTVGVQDESSSEPTEARVDFFTMLGLVPAVIRNYLVSKEISEKREALYLQAGLNEPERTITLYTELEVFFGDILLDDFPDTLFSRLPWKDDEEERARKLAVEIMGRIMLPAQAYLGDVPRLITELDGDPKQYPQEILELRTVSYKDGAAEIAEAVAPDDMGTDMRKRLAFIVESRLRSVRDDADTLEMLTKSKKTGGMELTEAQANDVIDAIKTKARMTKYVEMVEEEKSAAPASEPVAQEAPAKQLTPVEIKRVYAGTAEEQESLAKRVKRFRTVTDSDSTKMRDAYYQVLYPPDLRPTDPLYVVSGLIAFAEDGEVSDLLKYDERYKDIIRKYYTETEKGAGKADEFSRFESDPTDPTFVNLFLQLLLRGFAGYDEAESARFGLRVTNALKKAGETQYAGLTVFEMDRSAFKWTSPVEFS